MQETHLSTIYDKETNKKIGRCNTYVYYDFIKRSENKMILKQTVVVDILNPFYKAIGDIIGRISGSEDLWDKQFTEELNTFKIYLEK